MSVAARPQKSDLVVVGGGMVGLAAACLLLSGLPVAQTPVRPRIRKPDRDINQHTGRRYSQLTHGTRIRRHAERPAAPIIQDHAEPASPAAVGADICQG